MTARLFVHSLDGAALSSHALAAGGLTDLAQRALLLAGPGDAVVVDAPLDAAWLAHLRALGLGAADDAVFVPRSAAGADELPLAERLRADRELCARLARHDWSLEPYLAGDAEHALADALGARLHGPPAELARWANAKSSLSALLDALALPRPEGVCVRCSEVADATRRALAVHGRVIVRADLSIGGRAVWPVASEAELERLAAAVADGPPEAWYLVERRLPMRSAPNVQFAVEADGPTLLGATDQWLAESLAYLGNLHPSRVRRPTELLRQGSALAAELGCRGYRGVLGIDFVETPSGALYPIEINARVNTSTFALVALATLEGAASPAAPRSPFLIRLGIATDARDFAALREALGAELFARPEKDGRLRAGVLPLLPPSKRRPRLDTIVVGASAAEVAAADARLARALGVELSRPEPFPSAPVHP